MLVRSDQRGGLLVSAVLAGRVRSRSLRWPNQRSSSFFLLRSSLPLLKSHRPLTSVIIFRLAAAARVAPLPVLLLLPVVAVSVSASRAVAAAAPLLLVSLVAAPVLVLVVVFVRVSATVSVSVSAAAFVSG